MSEASPKWNDEQISMLRKLHADGRTNAQIAEALSGAFTGNFTRSSCAGKIQRLGLCHKKICAKPKKTKPAIRLVFKQHPVPVLLRVIAEPEPLPVVLPDVNPLHVSIIELRRGECRFPYGDGPFTFCGHPALEGPYCPSHRQIAYRRRETPQPTD